MLYPTFLLFALSLGCFCSPISHRTPAILYSCHNFIVLMPILCRELSRTYHHYQQHRVYLVYPMYPVNQWPNLAIVSTITFLLKCQILFILFVSCFFVIEHFLTCLVVGKIWVHRLLQLLLLLSVYFCCKWNVTAKRHWFENWILIILFRNGVWR